MILLSITIILVDIIDYLLLLLLKRISDKNKIRIHNFTINYQDLYQLN